MPREFFTSMWYEFHRSCAHNGYVWKSIYSLISNTNVCVLLAIPWQNDRRGSCVEMCIGVYCVLSRKILERLDHVARETM